jgi:hypothetical protein
MEKQMGIGDMLQAQQDAEDAARYRWLRSHIAETIIGRIRREGENLTMDELVDKRMKRTSSSREPK